MRWILSFILFFFCICCQAQNDFTYFNKTYWADSMNILSTAIEPIEDGYLVLGPYSNTENHALYIRKIDEKGRTVWFKNLDETFLGDIITTGRQVIKVDESHFAVAYTYIYNDEDWRVQLVKFNSEGDILFHREFADSQIVRNTRQLITTYDKGFVFIGAKKVYNPISITIFYMIKTDSLGNKEWEKTYTYEDFLSIAYSVQQTPDGGYILGGYTKTGSMNKNNDMFIVKTDALGNEEWSKTVGGGWDDCPAIVHCLTTVDEYLQMGEIEYLIAGCYIEEFNSSENRYDIYLFKMDTKGELIWEEGYNPTNTSDNLAAYLIMPNGNFYGVGTRSVNLKQRPVLYYFNDKGVLRWEKEFSLDTLAHVYMRDLQATEDGGLVLAGFKFSPNPQKSWVLKVDSLGNTCMPADCDSTVVFTNIEETSIIQNPFSLSLYPNPASEKVEVAYQIPKDGILKMYDYQGRLIEEYALVANHSRQAKVHLSSVFHVF